MSTYLKIFIIVLIGFMLTAVSYSFTAKGLKKYSTHKYPRIKEIFTGTTNYDILFIGSSRTHSTIMPRVIDSITGLSSFNAGTEGGTLWDYKMTLDGYLVNHPAPKLLLLNVDPFSFEEAETVYNPVQYLPFVKNNSVIAETFSSMGYHTFQIKYAPAFNFIYMDDYSKNNALAGWRGANEIPGGEFQDKGFLSNTYECVDPVKYRNDSSALHPIPRNLKRFDELISTCREKNIELILTYAPEYRYQFQRSFSNFKVFTDIMYLKAKAGNLPYYRDDSLAMNTDSCLFRDIRHVNTAGAAVYSKIMGQRIRALYQ